MGTLIRLNDRDMLFVARYMDNACDLHKTCQELGMSVQAGGKALVRCQAEIDYRLKEAADLSNITLAKVCNRLFEVMMMPDQKPGDRAAIVAAAKELGRLLDMRPPERKIVTRVNAGLDAKRLAEIRAVVLGVPTERILEAEIVEEEPQEH